MQGLGEDGRREGHKTLKIDKEKKWVPQVSMHLPPHGGDNRGCPFKTGRTQFDVLNLKALPRAYRLNGNAQLLTGSSRTPREGAIQPTASGLHRSGPPNDGSRWGPQSNEGRPDLPV